MFGMSLEAVRRAKAAGITRIILEVDRLSQIEPGLAATVRSSSINAQHRLIEMQTHRYLGEPHLG